MYPWDTNTLMIKSDGIACQSGCRDEFNAKFATPYKIGEDMFIPRV